MGDRVLELIISAKDLTGRTVSKFRRNWRAMRRTITRVTTAVVGFTAAVTGAVLGLTKLTERGEKVVAVQDAFARMTGDSSAALQKLRDAARGTINDFELMARANQALTLGGGRLG